PTAQPPVREHRADRGAAGGLALGAAIHEARADHERVREPLAGSPRRGHDRCQAAAADARAVEREVVLGPVPLDAEPPPPRRPADREDALRLRDEDRLPATRGARRAAARYRQRRDSGEREEPASPHRVSGVASAGSSIASAIRSTGSPASVLALSRASTEGASKRWKMVSSPGTNVVRT